LILEIPAPPTSTYSTSHITYTVRKNGNSDINVNNILIAYNLVFYSDKILIRVYKNIIQFSNDMYLFINYKIFF
jgi:hypothetical protein